MDKEEIVALHGDCIEQMDQLISNGIKFHAIITDPPYELGFMGRQWDKSGIAFQVDVWKRCFDLLLPGGHMVAFGGTRTYHRMVCAIEDAGFEIRDQLGWLFGTGFPKSQNVANAIDAKIISGKCRTEDMRKIRLKDDYIPSGRGRINYDHGAGSNMDNIEGKVELQSEIAKQWQGWGTALKPAWEPICLSRKPFNTTVAENVIKNSVGGLNIDGCRIPISDNDDIFAKNPHTRGGFGHGNASIYGDSNGAKEYDPSAGRFPSNIIHDGSEEVENEFAKYGQRKSRSGYNDTNTPSRFFYSAKASKEERNGSKHPTVKPINLMRYLCRLVTPSGGYILDPFAGSGTTGEAAVMEGFNVTLIEKEEEYFSDINRRIEKIKINDTSDIFEWKEHEK